MMLSVILPAYCEADNLKLLLPKLRDALQHEEVAHEVLVVDTMKPMDDTPAICVESEVRYVPRRGGNDYGDAIRTGIADAVGQYIAVMDADGSHDPKDLIRMLDTIRSGSDVVIGSRYIEGGGTHNGWILKLMSKIVNIVYRAAFSLNIKDVSNSFRVYDADKLKQIHLECSNFDLVEEILIKLVVRYPALRIAEIPVYFDRRMYGESKRDLVRFICTYITTMLRLKKIELAEKKEQAHAA